MEKESQKSTSQKQLAGFWIRFLALAIDFLVLVTVQRVLRFSFREPLRGVFQLVFFLGYSPLMLYYYQSTLGKMALGLKLVSDDGKKLEFFQVLLREWVGKFISSVFFSLGFIWVALDSRKQAWHDKIAHTQVIKI
jgi:uncharacterized RDD family membrane protein YckC